MTYSNFLHFEPYIFEDGVPYFENRLLEDVVDGLHMLANHSNDGFPNLFLVSRSFLLRTEIVSRVWREL